MSYLRLLLRFQIYLDGLAKLGLVQFAGLVLPSTRSWRRERLRSQEKRRLLSPDIKDRLLQ